MLSCECSCFSVKDETQVNLKGLSHEIDFKNFDKTLKNLT